MEILTPIDANLTQPPITRPIVNVKQGDNARGLLITLWSDGNVLSLTTESVNIYVKKPDGTEIYNSCSIVDGKVKAMFTTQMVAVVTSELPIELQIISQSEDNQPQILSTPIAYINVMPTNIDSSAIESTNEFTALETALSQVSGLLDNLASQPITFTRAGTRRNVESGESLSVLWGKVSRYFNDFGTAAFQSVLNNTDTSSAGYVLDARQGKILDDKITEIDGKLENWVYGSNEAIPVNANGSETVTVTISGESRTPVKVIASLYNSSGGTGELAISSYISGGFTANIKSSASAPQYFRIEYIAIFE